MCARAVQGEAREAGRLRQEVRFQTIFAKPFTPSSWTATLKSAWCPFFLLFSQFTKIAGHVSSRLSPKSVLGGKNTFFFLLCDSCCMWNLTEVKEKAALTPPNLIGHLNNWKRSPQTFLWTTRHVTKSCGFQGTLGRGGACTRGLWRRGHEPPASAVFHRDCGRSQRLPCRLCGSGWSWPVSVWGGGSSLWSEARPGGAVTLPRPPPLTVMFACSCFWVVMNQSVDEDVLQVVLLFFLFVFFVWFWFFLRPSDLFFLHFNASENHRFCSTKWTHGFIFQNLRFAQAITATCPRSESKYSDLGWLITMIAFQRSHY